MKKKFTEHLHSAWNMNGLMLLSYSLGDRLKLHRRVFCFKGHCHDIHWFFALFLHGQKWQLLAQGSRTTDLTAEVFLTMSTNWNRLVRTLCKLDWPGLSHDWQCLHTPFHVLVGTLLILIIRSQCSSYRRYLASPKASSFIWTQVERFGRFFPSAIFFFFFFFFLPVYILQGWPDS